VTRRQLAAGALSQAVAPPLILPRRLKPGDTVALVTPSTEVVDPELLIMARETCEHFGLRAEMMPSVGRRQRDFQESVASRASDFNRAWTDPRFAAVFCVRGGFGSQHFLDRIDYGAVRRNPKVFLGYSDITALHMAIHRRTGLATFHGPVPLSGFTAFTQEHFRRVLFETKPAGVLTNPPEPNRLRPQHRLRAVREGVASGRLVGGNLTLVATTMGTPYEIDTAGRILFLEDVGEQIYSIDRMLTQLRLAGKLQRAAGIVWGECSDCPPKDNKPSSASAYGLAETVDNLLGDLGIPVLSGLVIGHTADQLTLPLGIRATLDAGRGTLRLDEAAVV
jgi:muramoyltetrapeptide carboxypeptidase